jgi:hypothetical protein
VLGAALACFVASIVLPGRIPPTHGATAETLAVARSVLALALNAAVALQAPLAWMVSGNAAALVALAIAFVGLLVVAPSRRRWDERCRAIEAAFAGKLAAASPPPSALPRNVLVSVVSLVALAAVALALAGHEFWATEVLHRPVTPMARLLMYVDLAAMLAAVAAMRFAGAATRRHPRWQRACGVLLLVCAGYLVVRAMRIV